MRALREHGIWRFRTKNFLVITDFNKGVWRTRVFRTNDEYPFATDYCGAPRLGVYRAIEQARKEMRDSLRFRINQR
jgi:hypothetical protein